jgi:hypothetical protein
LSECYTSSAFPENQIMPDHDWSRVYDGAFHAFDLGWIAELQIALNQGLLPPDYYAMAEQIAGPAVPDVLTLQTKSGQGESWSGEPIAGATAVATAPPEVAHSILQDRDMRLTRPRMTVRWMMVLVAVISLILGAEVKRRHWVLWSRHCVEKARYHRAKAAGARGICIDAFDTPPDLATDEVSAQYHDQMVQKWEVAASRPWSRVQADSQTSESARRSGLGWVACRCNWCKEWVKAGGVIPR